MRSKRASPIPLASCLAMKDDPERRQRRIALDEPP